MKLTGTEANRYLARPDPNRAGLLIFGADPMRVALKRQEAILAMIGATGATATNSRGDILGRYRNADGVFQGFLLVGFRPACAAGS